METPKRKPLGEKNRNLEEKTITQVRSHNSDHENKENLKTSPYTGDDFLTVRN